MIKFLALVVIFAVAVNAYPAVEQAADPQVPKGLSADGQTDLATKNQEVDLNAGDDTDLKGSETFGFGYYPAYGYGRGWGGYGGWGYGGGWGGYRGGWGGYGGWGYPRHYYW